MGDESNLVPFDSRESYRNLSTYPSPSQATPPLRAPGTYVYLHVDDADELGLGEEWLSGGKWEVGSVIPEWR